MIVSLTISLSLQWVSTSCLLRLIDWDGRNGRFYNFLLMNSNTKLTRRRREEERQVQGSVKVRLAWLLVRRKGHMTAGIS